MLQLSVYLFVVLFFSTMWEVKNNADKAKINIAATHFFPSSLVTVTESSSARKQKQ